MCVIHSLMLYLISTRRKIWMPTKQGAVKNKTTRVSLVTLEVAIANSLCSTLTVTLRKTTFHWQR